MVDGWSMVSELVWCGSEWEFGGGEMASDVGGILIQGCGGSRREQLD